MCIGAGLQVLISLVAMATTILAAFTGYQVGKNNFLNKILKKSGKQHKSNKTKKSCEIQLAKVVEVAENKYENIDEVIDDASGEDNASDYVTNVEVDDATGGQQYDDVAAEVNDVTAEVNDVTTGPSAPSREAIYEDHYLNEENIYEELETIRENTKAEK